MSGVDLLMGCDVNMRKLRRDGWVDGSVCISLGQCMFPFGAGQGGGPFTRSRNGATPYVTSHRVHGDFIVSALDSLCILKSGES